jgi:hypothetical protein
VYERQQPASLAHEAVQLFQQDLAGLGVRGRAFAEAEHSWSTVFDRLFAVYRAVLGR